MEEWFLLEDRTSGLNQFRFWSGSGSAIVPAGNSFTYFPATVAVGGDGNLWFSVQSPQTSPTVGVLNVASPSGGPTVFSLSTLAGQASPAGGDLISDPCAVALGVVYLVVWKGNTAWIDTVPISNPSGATGHQISTAVASGVTTIGYSPIDGHVYVVDGTASANVYDVDPATGNATPLGATNAPNSDLHHQMIALSDGTLAYLSSNSNPATPNGAIVHIVPNRVPNPISVVVPVLNTGCTVNPCNIGLRWGIVVSPGADYGSIWDTDGGNVRAGVW